MVATPDENNTVFPEGGLSDITGNIPENWPSFKEGRQGYGLKEITLPQSITFEGKTYEVRGFDKGAIMNEPALERIILPEEGRIWFYDYNLLDCPKLREVKNSRNIDYVSNGCFVNVPELRCEADSGDNGERALHLNCEIGCYSFRNCGFEKIALSSGIIWDGCFSNMPNLRSFDFSNTTVWQIGNDVLCNCPLLEEIDFRNKDHMGPYEIGASFKNNASLKRVFFEESMEYYTIMDNRGSFIMGPAESDFSDRSLPETWTANNPAWTDDPEKCCGSAPSFLLEKSGDYIDITAYQSFSDDKVYNQISSVNFKARPDGRYAQLHVYAINGDRKELIRVYYLSNAFTDHETQEISIDCVSEEDLPYEAEYFRLELQAPEGTTATIDDVFCTYSSMLMTISGTGHFMPLGNVTSHTFRNLKSAHRYYILITSLKEDGQQYEVACAPMVRTLTAPSAIEETEAGNSAESALTEEGTVYDLFGRVVLQNVTCAEAAGRLAPGIYIHNGTKFIVK